MAKKQSLDIAGQHFGRLTAVRPTEKRVCSSVVWECQCECGNTAYYSVSYLRSKAKSCGCLRKEYVSNQLHDVTNARFGRLTAVEPTSRRDSSRSVIWKWQCDCGKIVEKPLNAVLSGKVQSCGCVREGKQQEIYEKGLKPGYIMGTNLHILRQDDTTLRSNNVTGVTGVCYLSKENRYLAHIRFQSVKIYRRYRTLDEAAAARQKMQIIHQGFLEWWDALSEQDKEVACAQYENEKATQAALLKKKFAELL